MPSDGTGGSNWPETGRLLTDLSGDLPRICWLLFTRFPQTSFDDERVSRR